MANLALTALRDRLELIINIPAGDNFIDSTEEDKDINEAYTQTFYKHDWPFAIKRFADVIIADQDRYNLQSDFRKMLFLFTEGRKMSPTSLVNIKSEKRGFAIDELTNEYILGFRPQTASTAYTLSNAETAADTVTIELDTVDGLAVGDEIWIDGTTTKEFTVVRAVDTSAKTITAKLKNNQSSGDILYLIDEIVYFAYYRTITLLSAGTDTTLMPESFDATFLNYAAYLFFTRNEQPERAASHLKVWEERTKEAFLAFDKESVGPTNEFLVDVL